MKPDLIVAALLACLVLAPLATAYHIQDRVGINGGISPERWGQQIGFVAPADDPSAPVCALLLTLPPPTTTAHDALCGPNFPGSLTGTQAGDNLASIQSCESMDASDAAAPGLGLTGVSQPGIGGLCYMSVGSDNGGAAGTCTTPTTGNEGRSTGWAPHYNGAGHCFNEFSLTPDSLPAIAAPAPSYYKIQMWDQSSSNAPTTHSGFAVKFQASIGSWCGPTSNAFVYDDQFAYTVSNGHVAGAPISAPAFATFGTYTVTRVAGPATSLSACISLPVAHARNPKPVAPSPPVVWANPGDRRASLTMFDYDGVSPITSWSIYRGLCQGCESLVATVPGGARDFLLAPYTDRGLTNGVQYWYYVVATNAAGSSPPSAETTVIVNDNSYPSSTVNAGSMACYPAQGTASTATVIVGSPNSGTYTLNAGGSFSGGVGAACKFEIHVRTADATGAAAREPLVPQPARPAPPQALGPRARPAAHSTGHALSTA
jgi:hypothetical protein